MQELAGKINQLGLEHVQLALLDLVQLDDKRKHQELGHLRAAGIKYSGGMFGFAGEDYSSIERIRLTGGFVPDAQWPVRKALAMEGAKLAEELGMKTILAHVGFVPPHSDANYKGIVDRIGELAAGLAEHGQALVMETGQEPASELLQFFKDLKAPNVHINFDPANMILYGAGDPIEAIKILGPYIKHVHVKDATASSKPGVEWGAEVPFGTGQVNPQKFLAALKSVGYTGPLAIEREAGDNRMGDIKTAIEVLKKNLA
jgi:sugar phosphate isomerase/epimerase